MALLTDNAESNFGEGFKKEPPFCIKDEKDFEDKLAECQSGVDKYNSTDGFKEHDNKTDYSEIDFAFITQMARRMNKNKGKYPKNNWKKPIDVEKLKQAMFRHIVAVMDDEYSDDGREFGHLEAIALNAMMINYQLKYLK